MNWFSLLPCSPFISFWPVQVNCWMVHGSQDDFWFLFSKLVDNTKILYIFKSKYILNTTLTYKRKLKLTSFMSEEYLNI